MTCINHHPAVRIAACVAFALCANALAASEARAELGGTTAAPQVPNTSIMRMLPGMGVEVRSSVDAGGTTINEYATSDGVIFAYTWQGPTMPDLVQLLGVYAQRLRAEAAKQFNATGRLHTSHVDDPDVIIEAGGQMRSYVGRAWLPAALPAGMSSDDLH